MDRNRAPDYIKAVIFDMDGLMLDTERLDLQHFKRAAKDFGYSGIEDVYLQTVGRNQSDSRKLFRNMLGEEFPFSEVHERWRLYSTDHAGRFGIPVKPGLQKLIARLNQLGFPRAVATSTARAGALALLEKANLLQHFKTVVAGDEVSRGKPDPEIFVTAAHRLGVKPIDCLVFEDSIAGIQGAHAAGMLTVLVPDLIPPSTEIREIAFQVLQSFEEALGMFGNNKSEVLD